MLVSAALRMQKHTQKHRTAKRISVGNALHIESPQVRQYRLGPSGGFWGADFLSRSAWVDLFGYEKLV
jgi:hypothetical protein